MLSIKNADLITPQGSKLLTNISLEVLSGKFLHIYGPNGCGKTSLIKALLDIDFKLTSVERQYKNYTYLPQLENKDFLLPLRVQEISSEGFLLDIQERKIMWNEASGGQRKKALIERTLKDKSELYILDEPYNHLDEKSIFKVNERLEEILQQGSSIVMVTHKAPKISENKMIKVDVSQWK